MSTLKDIEFVADETLTQVEADSYYCLGKFIAGIQDHYTTGQPGILHMILQLEKCLKRVDPELHEHIVVRCQLKFLYFSFRWMACLLVRELSLPCIVRIWDTYLCQDDDTEQQSFGKKGFDEFHVCVCAAILHSLRDKLLKMNGDELLEFLTMRMKDFATNELGPRDVDLWLSQAHVWQSEGVLDDVVFDDSDVDDSNNDTYSDRTEEKQIDSVEDSVIEADYCAVEYNAHTFLSPTGLKSGSSEEISMKRSGLVSVQNGEKSATYEPPTTSMSDVDFLCY